MTTPTDLIRQSLFNAGISVSQTIYAEDIYRAFSILNQMLGEWTRQRWLVPNLLDIAHTADGSTSYTLGPGLNFNTPRIDKIEAGYARLLPVVNNNPVDFPLAIIEAHEDYASIALKNLQSFPIALFYDSGFPTGNVYVYPVPQSGQYEIHLILKNTLSQFTSITQDITFPNEYINTLIWNLSVRIRPLYQLPPDPVINSLAMSSLGVLRIANTQVPTLSLPGVLQPRNGGFDVTLGNLNSSPWGGS